MLTIGEFSRLCRVSPKTLRYYDSIGLLKPAWLNNDNDYRYYTIEQLEQILLINRLKEYHFPLIEILNILNTNNDDYLMECIKRKQEEIVKQIDREKRLLEQIEKDINTIKNGKKLININKDIKIELVNTEPVRVMSVRRPIEESQAGQLFNELIPLIEQFNLQVYDYPITVYHDTEYQDSGLLDLEMCVPVLGGDNKFIRILEGGHFIYTKYEGDYKGLIDAIKAVYAWKEKEGYEIISSPYQKYIKGMADTDNPEEYITEIYLPVRKRTSKNTHEK